MSQPAKSTPWKLAVTVTSGVAALGLAAYFLYLRDELQKEQQRTDFEISNRQSELAQTMQGVDEKQIDERRKQLEALNARRTDQGVAAAVTEAFGGEWALELTETKPQKASDRGETLLTLRRDRMPVAAWPEMLTALERVAAAWSGCGVYAAHLKADRQAYDRSFESMVIKIGQDFKQPTTSKTP